MNNKTILVFTALAFNYVLVFQTRLFTGLNFYIVHILVYVIVVLLLWEDVRGYLKLNRLAGVVFYYTISFISVYMLIGLLTGYGISPYSTSLVGLFVNTVYTLARYTSFEFIRFHLARNLRFRNRELAVYIPALVVWFLTWFPYPLLALSLDYKGLRTLFRYLIPSLVSNLFSTFLTLNNGFVASIVYNVFPQIVLRVLPYLPNLNWLIEGVFSTFVPLMGFYMVLPYTSFGRRNVRLLARESKSIAGIVVYFGAVVLISMVFQGHLGVRLYVISSRSMEPTLRVGDLVVVCSFCGEPSKGDIVAYVSEYGVVIHRVVETINETGLLVTKGDANTNVDPNPISRKYVLGRVVLTLPRLGYPAIYARRILSENILTISIILLVSLLGIGALMRCRR